MYRIEKRGKDTTAPALLLYGAASAQEHYVRDRLRDRPVDHARVD